MKCLGQTQHIGLITKSYYLALVWDVVVMQCTDSCHLHICKLIETQFNHPPALNYETNQIQILMIQFFCSEVIYDPHSASLKNLKVFDTFPTKRTQEKKDQNMKLSREQVYNKEVGPRCCNHRSAIIFRELKKNLTRGELSTDRQ